MPRYNEYEYMDKRLAILKKRIRELYVRFQRGANFDDLNDLSDDTKLLYTKVLQEIEKELLKIAKNKYQEYVDIDLDKITDKWIEKNLVDNISKVTKFSLSNEMERQRARMFEMLVISEAIEEERMIIAKNERYIEKIANEYAIESADKGKQEAYKENGVKYVKWVSEHDNKTCDECYDLDGKIFTLNELPAKPHYNCRCTIEEIEETEEENS